MLPVGDAVMVHVHLQCPGCSDEWHAATIDTESWWGKGVKPEVVARQCYCRQCHHKPPMAVILPQAEALLTQGDLLAQA